MHACFGLHGGLIVDKVTPLMQVIADFSQINVPHINIQDFKLNSTVPTYSKLAPEVLDY